MSWDNLSLRERAEYIKTGVRNGITDINEIKGAYNKFDDGGYKSSKSIRDRISKWEGSSMYKAAPDTGRVNNSFEFEERAFWNALPKGLRGQLSQEELDALYSTSYNIGSGNFRRRVVPALERLYNGTGSVEEVQRSMYGTNDKKLKGLQTRRAIERKLFADAYNNKQSRGTTSNYPQASIILPDIESLAVQSPADLYGSEGLKPVEYYNPFTDTKSEDNSVLYNLMTSSVPTFKSKIPELILPYYK